MLTLSHNINIYKAIVECVVTYCVTSWGGAAQSYLITLERAQRT